MNLTFLKQPTLHNVCEYILIDLFLSVWILLLFAEFARCWFFWIADDRINLDQLSPRIFGLGFGILYARNHIDVIS